MSPAANMHRKPSTAKWVSYSESALLCLWAKWRGAAGNPRFPRLLPGTLGINRGNSVTYNLSSSCLNTKCSDIFRELNLTPYYRFQVGYFPFAIQYSKTAQQHRSWHTTGTQWRSATLLRAHPSSSKSSKDYRDYYLSEETDAWRGTVTRLR